MARARKGSAGQSAIRSRWLIRVTCTRRVSSASSGRPISPDWPRPRPVEQPARSGGERRNVAQPVDRLVHLVEGAAVEKQHARVFGVPPVRDDLVREELGQAAVDLEMPERLFRVREHQRGARRAPLHEHVEHLQDEGVVDPSPLGATGAESPASG